MYCQWQECSATKIGKGRSLKDTPAPPVLCPLRRSSCCINPFRRMKGTRQPGSNSIKQTLWLSTTGYMSSKVKVAVSSGPAATQAASTAHAKHQYSALHARAVETHAPILFIASFICAQTTGEKSLKLPNIVQESGITFLAVPEWMPVTTSTAASCNTSHSSH